MSDYEFTDQQNLIFLKLVNSMRGFGIISAIIGGALVVSGLSLGAEGASGFVAASRGGQGITAILVGIIWWTSSSGFYAITKTEGSDISQLMDSIKLLSTGFMFILAFALLRVFLQGVIAANNILIAAQ
jgi:hypothetical protein